MRHRRTRHRTGRRPLTTVTASLSSSDAATSQASPVAVFHDAGVAGAETGHGSASDSHESSTATSSIGGEEWEDKENRRPLSAATSSTSKVSHAGRGNRIPLEDITAQFLQHQNMDGARTSISVDEEGWVDVDEA
ncbi:hypothetical protein HDU96_007748 [Phlyctochytrium bullatum]|nr:hypothetical protein HDU96_007748 [Phlyctochytrium bullatum]